MSLAMLGYVVLMVRIPGLINSASLDILRRLTPVLRTALHCDNLPYTNKTTYHVDRILNGDY